MAAEKLRLQEKLYSTQDKLALATEQHAAKVKSLESNGDNLQEKVQSLTRDLQVTREKSLTLERHNQSLELQLQKVLPLKCHLWFLNNTKLLETDLNLVSYYI